MDRARIPFSIDFGIGDVIVPSPVERTLPALLPEFAEPKILTYSLESTVAEKLDAIISLMEATSRMKDIF
ncbi:MAG: nucleotidyl transferase AbiEii/AbiGii toxin family protein [Thermoanaerobacterales bacterium]|nr:nucleotidyl transferase AbiEii/AbiGii toxin family protein [Thermoanaerobacterales bacterium]HHX75038.1 nucleotidyl transferase AbiEii/AbiGii toxin family protein [Bacillota bacterium]